MRPNVELKVRLMVMTKCDAVCVLNGSTDAADASSQGAKPTLQPRLPRNCGSWARDAEGGVFSSPNYPKTYPPNKECIYILEGNKHTLCTLVVSHIMYLRNKTDKMYAL